MERIERLTEEFVSKYESFMTGCDAIEDIGGWNAEEDGEMDGFYTNDLIGVILRLIAVDGVISEKEVEYLNKNFGFSYSLAELKDVYKNCKENVGISLNEQFRDGVLLMRRKNEKIAKAYEELLGLICDIIIESDGVIAPEEIKEAQELKKLFS